MISKHIAALGLILCLPAHADWKMNRLENAMDKTSTLLLAVEGDAPYPSQILAPKKPLLLVQCEKGKPELVLRAHVQFQRNTTGYDSHRIRLKFDDEKPVSVTATEGTDHRSLFIPSPKNQIQKLLTAKKLMVEVTPWQRTEATSTFQTTGLNNFKPFLTKECGIK